MSSLNIAAATLIVSIISMVGILLLSLNKRTLHNILHVLIAFSSGTILGTALFDLLPEALELIEEAVVYNYIALGFVLFFFLERFIYWYHGHGQVNATDGKTEERTVSRTFVYLNLIGDGIHNFTDGMIIAASFFLGTSIGLVTTLAVIFHELPQEMGDYAILIYGGLKERKALLYNFVVALTVVLGGLLTIQFIAAVSALKAFLIAIAAGGFIYLSASELIPELKEEKNFAKSMIQFAIFVLGMTLIWYLGTIITET